MIINCKKHLTPPNDDNIMNRDIWADSIVIKTVGCRPSLLLVAFI